MLIELTLLSGAASYWFTRYQDKYHPNWVSMKHFQRSHLKKFSPKQLFKDIKSALSGNERQQQLNPNFDLSLELRKQQESATAIC